MSGRGDSRRFPFRTTTTTAFTLTCGREQRVLVALSLLPRANKVHGKSKLVNFAVLRYVERNPLRANMVARSQDWEWSSLKPTARSGADGLLSEGPFPKRSQWTRFVNGVETEGELASLRRSVVRGTPFGESSWQHATAVRLGLESSMRPRGRPRKPNK